MDNTFKYEDGRIYVNFDNSWKYSRKVKELIAMDPNVFDLYSEDLVICSDINSSNPFSDGVMDLKV